MCKKLLKRRMDDVMDPGGGGEVRSHKEKVERKSKNKMEAERSQSAESSSGVKSNERSRKAWGVWAYGKGGIRVLGTV